MASNLIWLRFASCGGDPQIFLWDVATGRTIRKFRGHDGVVNSVSHLSLHLASVSYKIPFVTSFRLAELLDLVTICGAAAMEYLLFARQNLMRD